MKILCSCGSVVRDIALAAQKLWVRFPGNTCTDKKKNYNLNAQVLVLWIKASAKCINVNVNEDGLCIIDALV